MAIYRNVSMTFWTDTKIADEFSPEDKYFMLYCLTNQYTNLCGCYEISIKQMCRDIGYNEETILKLLDRFNKSYQIIKYNQENKEIYIKNWYKYNWTKSEKLDKPLISEIQKIKTETFKKELSEIYNKRDTVSIPYIYPIDTTVSVSSTDNIYISSNNIYNSNNNINNIISDNEKETKHKYGEYQHVLLTDKEYEKLKNDFSNYEELITYLDEYIEMKNYKAKNHYLAIKKWVVDAVIEYNKKHNKVERQEKDFHYVN